MYSQSSSSKGSDGAIVKWEGLVRGGWMNGGILKWILVPWAFLPVSLFLGLHERTISL